MRRLARLTQAELAARVDMSQGTIGNIESGSRAYGQSVLAIAKVLETNPEYLLLKSENSEKLTEPPRVDVVQDPVKVQVMMTREAALIASWLDKLPADSIQKIQVSQICMKAIAEALQQPDT